MLCLICIRSADERLEEQREVMVTVDFTGRVFWSPPAIFKSTCTIDIRNFPFDYQNCHLRFASWTHDGHRMDLQFFNNETTVDTEDYTESNEWEITAKPARRFVNMYKNCPKPYPVLTFFLL
ncbi:unnamed protein product [Protopolystoma xenopodis]|uniref:Neurotransmitter-gated ion-channel ligand-binding domain-containing protein n=1 Tax=Protopolystoma xenopodis TaxID=117903 RepID=A0A3S5AQJ2_9PLAT|nr:unnamed protein product [Protopolystoma xenopodis]